MQKMVAYNLFDKFSLDALESLEMMLRNCGRENELYGIIKDVLKIKQKGISLKEENDIISILNSNISEIKYNVDSFSDEELYILEDTLNLAINNISKGLIEPLVAILEDNKKVVESKLPIDLSKDEIEAFLSKLNLLELDAIYAITKFAEDINLSSLYEVANQKYGKIGLSRWKNFEIPFSQFDGGILALINDIPVMETRELNFLESLIMDADLYIANKENNDFETETIGMHLTDLINAIDDQIRNRDNEKVKTLEIKAKK